MGEGGFEPQTDTQASLLASREFQRARNSLHELNSCCNGNEKVGYTFCWLVAQLALSYDVLSL